MSWGNSVVFLEHDDDDDDGGGGDDDGDGGEDEIRIFKCTGDVNVLLSDVRIRLFSGVFCVS